MSRRHKRGSPAATLLANGLHDTAARLSVFSGLPFDEKNYESSRRAAQTVANQTGRDVGIEWNDVFKHWHVFSLPLPQNRSGFELRCEVVRPENPPRSAEELVLALKAALKSKGAT